MQLRSEKVNDVIFKNEFELKLIKRLNKKNLKFRFSCFLPTLSLFFFDAGGAGLFFLLSVGITQLLLIYTVFREFKLVAWGGIRSIS